MAHSSAARRGFTRRDFLKAAAAGAAFAAPALASCRGRSDSAGPAAGGFLPLPESLPLAGLRLSGDWGYRYSAALHNLVGRPDRYPLSTFAASAAGRPETLWPDWPGDQIGRWLSMLHVAEGYGWTPARAQRSAIADLALPLQTPEGNFGLPGTADKIDSRIPSGNAFALRGLMDAYADTREPRYLEAARRLARYFEKAAPLWETKRDGLLHEFYGHCLDGLVALSGQGGDGWALELAKRLGARAGRTAHTHHSLSMVRGLIDLARAANDPAFLAKAKDYAAWCRSARAVTGGLPEAMPLSPQDEGCALADWIVVNLMLYQASGEESYLDAAEHTLVNHFAFNQFVTGGFGHRSFGREVLGGKNWQGWEGRYGSENPGCCSIWGAWALGWAGRSIVTSAGSEASIHLYPAAEIDLPGQGLRLSLESDFPRQSRARIRVQAQRGGEAVLALRIPAWAEGLEVRRDGAPVREKPEGRRLRLRGWKGVETIEILFKSGTRFVPWTGEEGDAFGVFDGPLCLGLPESAGNVEQAWTVAVDERGRPRTDVSGAVLAESAAGAKAALLPIASDWQHPDVFTPRRWRVLFGRRS